MNRNEKLRKLGNAIRAYRGATSTQPGDPNPKWIRSPQMDKVKRIQELLIALGFWPAEGVEAIDKIDNFKTIPEFEKWMKGLSEPKKDETGL